ncbi:hypothetical protein AVEN_195340-1 [Araneus ventricosus]|uniref:Uncharacterized protein n=1 Tax=Araneus ventricosus TaxID=182803 RepID=A0A4Y2NU47_ARAVE|nr:hypothetical protein AVEN_249655-1 [Araneus ventricosus]GBN41554.1 hypothetical protein AVEN_54346-1 [Araneus ventricosus]GBN42537.1 hypothetical protein AVEN_164329-1 [Araneus ventricosus]GBN42544.1 hypothetical protein AVEN_195340-1 [Araneus ventricosus]
MTIRKCLGKESNSKRCVPIKCVPISTVAGSRTKSQSFRVHRLLPVRMRMENRMKKSTKQESTNIVHRRLRPVHMSVEMADSLEMRLYKPTDSQPFDGFGPEFYTDLHS